MQQRNSTNETNNCNKETHQKQTTEALNKQMQQASKQTNATTQSSSDILFGLGSDLLCAEVSESNDCYENEGTENPST